MVSNIPHSAAPRSNGVGRFAATGTRYRLQLSLSLILLAGPACKSPPAPTERPALAPTLDRLVSAYEDLASRNFQVIADFEAPVQGQLFRRHPGGAGAVTISTDRAQHDTGVGSLKMPLFDSSQQVVAQDTPEGQWALHRDWSTYHLLLLSVWSPRSLGGFRLSVRSGTDMPLIYEHPRIFLQQGWNRIRIDLGELRDRIDLHDVRELRFWCAPLDTPIDLYLDDLILTDNARDLFVTDEREPGDLYVRSQGRQLIVGATSLFELVFARGQIRQWFDLVSDPGRLHNLAGAGTVGPNPVILPSQADGPVRLDDIAQWAPLGAMVESYQTVVEATPLRVVIQGQWRFGTLESPPGDASPHLSWSYSFYRGGRLYVECSGTIRTDDLDASGLGMFFSCDGASGFSRHIAQADAGAAGDRPAIGRAPYVLFSRSEPGRADLLVVPFSASTARILENPDDSRLCAFWPVTTTNDQFTFSALMRVQPADIDTPSQAGPLATDYCHPLPIDVDAGSLVQTDPGDFDNDGFSEARGYYVLQLDGNVARVRINGESHLRFSPVFKLVDVTNRDVWVYVDGRQITNLQRNRHGDVLFEVPGVISDEVLIEVTSMVRESESGS